MNRRSSNLVYCTTREALQINSCWNHLSMKKKGEAFSGSAVRAAYLEDSGAKHAGPLTGYVRVAGGNYSFGGLDKLCEEGLLFEALQVVDRLDQQGSLVPPKIYYSLIKACISKEDLAAGKELLRLILRSGVGFHTFLGSHLIRMFASCGSLPEANQVFSKLTKPNVYTWSAIISAHAKLGQDEQAIKLYNQAIKSGVKPDGHVFVAALKACSNSISLQQGQLIHTDIIHCDFESAVFVGNALVDMYAKCGSVIDAQRVFAKRKERDLVTWNAMISGYAQHGYGAEAFQLLQQMQQEGLEPNSMTWSSIIAGYARHGHVHEAFTLFQQMREDGREPNNATWNALILGFAKHGHCKEALQLFQHMQEEGMQPDNVTFLCIVSVILNMSTLDEAKKIQAQLMEADYMPPIYSGSTLITMARRVFDKLPKRALEAWNAMIAAYAQQGKGLEALRLFEQMQQQDTEPDNITFVSILKGCSSISALEQGKLMHRKIIENGFELDTFVGSTLVDMYVKCGSLTNARIVFDKLPKRDVVTWSAMIAGCTNYGHCADGLRLFHLMKWEGVEPNQVTFVFLLKACSNLAALDQGKLIHAHIIESDCELDINVGSTLIEMYAKCGNLEDAQLMFDKLPTEIPVTWNAMIVGYALSGDTQEAFQLFQRMLKEGMEPNDATCVCILKVCSSIVALDQGKLVHASLITSGFELDPYAGSTLIDMYAKCGSIKDACRVFETLPKRDVVTWNAIISGYAQTGNHKLAKRCFQDLQVEGLKPDAITFVCLLSTCSHRGLVDEGCVLFKLMIEGHAMVPTVEHYNCMVDLLGRVGLLNEAEDLLQSMPLPPSIVGWTSLLSHCRTHTYAELGRRCFDQIVAIDCGDASFYVLMSDIYALAGMSGSADQVEDHRKCAEAWKKPAKACIEVNKEVYSFVVGDRSHSQLDCIYAKLNLLSTQIKAHGNMPHGDFATKFLLDNYIANVK